MEELELKIFETDLTPIGIVDEIISLVWTPTYWDEGTNGDFKLLVPVTENNTELLLPGKILMKNEEIPVFQNDEDEGKWNRAVQITYRNITRSNEGTEQIELQGCFLKKWLSKRIILNKISTSATVQEIINQIVEENLGEEADTKRQISTLTILKQEVFEGDAIDYTNEDYADAGAEIAKLALTGELGFDILANQSTKQFGFYLYKGKNLTSTNEEQNTPAIFSRDFENVNVQEFTQSEDGVKNAMYVTGAENASGVKTFLELENELQGLERDEVYVDLSSVSRTYTENDNEVTISETEYVEMLKSSANTELNNYAESIAFSSSMNLNSNLTYREDFNIGDQITCVENSWGIKLDARITAVCETYQSGIKEVEATLGDSLPTLIQQIRKVR